MRIKDTSKQARLIRDTSPTAKKVDPAVVAAALGAEQVGEIEGGRGGGPVSLLALRRELASRLVATGGRRRLAGTSRRQKIPVGDVEWSVLEHIAQKLGARGRRVSVGQLVSALVKRAVANIDPVNWLAAQLSPPDSDFALWLFAEALRRRRAHLTRHPDDPQHLIADAREQARLRKITEELLRRIEAEKDLAKAYAHAVEATDLKLERALQELDWAERAALPTRI